MKKPLKITALLFAIMLIVFSCVKDSKSEGKSESKSDAERFCEISKKMMAIESRKTTSRDIENLDKWDIEVANFEKKYKNNKEFIKRYKACMKEK